MRISDWSSDVCSSDLLRRVSCGDDRQTNEGDREPAAFRYEAQYALARLQLSGLQQTIEQQIERGRANIAFLGEIGEPTRLRNFPVIGHHLIHHEPEMLRRGEIGRTPVCTPVTNAQHLSRFLLANKHMKA